MCERIFCGLSNTASVGELEIHHDAFKIGNHDVARELFTRAYACRAVSTGSRLLKANMLLMHPCAHVDSYASQLRYSKQSGRDFSMPDRTSDRLF